MTSYMFFCVCDSIICLMTLYAFVAYVVEMGSVQELHAVLEAPWHLPS